MPAQRPAMGATIRKVAACFAVVCAVALALSAAGQSATSMSAASASGQAPRSLQEEIIPPGHDKSGHYDPCIDDGNCASPGSPGGSIHIKDVLIVLALVGGGIVLVSRRLRA
jgi:hypothetical protein